MIQEGKKVKFDYVLTVKGEVYDSTKDKEPMEYVHGKQMIIPGLEREMEGLEEGAQKDIIVGPEDAYGPVNPKAIVEMPKSALKGDQEPRAGMALLLQTQAGQKLQGVIQEVKDESIVVNFNHPLAGRELKFHVTIVEVKEAA